MSTAPVALLQQRETASPRTERRSALVGQALSPANTNPVRQAPPAELTPKAARPYFRLHRVEPLNRGTFHKQARSRDLGGNNALLTIAVHLEPETSSARAERRSALVGRTPWSARGPLAPPADPTPKAAA